MVNKGDGWGKQDSETQRQCLAGLRGQQILSWCCGRALGGGGRQGRGDKVVAFFTCSFFLLKGATPLLHLPLIGVFLKYL